MARRRISAIATFVTVAGIIVAGCSSAEPSSSADVAYSNSPESTSAMGEGCVTKITPSAASSFRESRWQAAKNVATLNITPADIAMIVGSEVIESGGDDWVGSTPHKTGGYTPGGAEFIVYNYLAPEEKGDGQEIGVGVVLGTGDVLEALAEKFTRAEARGDSFMGDRKVPAPTVIENTPSCLIASEILGQDGDRVYTLAQAFILGPGYLALGQCHWYPKAPSPERITECTTSLAQLVLKKNP